MDDKDKTIKNLKEEIIAKNWYPGDVGFLELRISRRKKKGELDADMSLAEKYGARTVRLLCMGPEWRGGFHEAPENRSRSNSPEVEQPSQLKQALEPAVAKPNFCPYRHNQRTDARSSQGEDEDSDFSDQSDNETKYPLGKSEIKIKCFRDGRKPWTMHTFYIHEDTGGQKDIAQLTEQILKDKGYPTGLTKTKDLILRVDSDKSKFIRKRGNRLEALLYLRTIKDKYPEMEPRKLYCKMAEPEKDYGPGYVSLSPQSHIRVNTHSGQ